MARTALEIADMIDQLKAAYVAASTGLVLLNDPDLPELLLARGYDPGSTIRLGRKDNTYYEGLDLYSAIEASRGNPGFNLDFLGGLITTMVSWVGDELASNGYLDKTPELEFFRHVRNGLSHGNRFYFKGGEPRRTAHFRGFLLDSSLHGANVLFEYMSIGDVFDLLDHVRTHLRAIA